MKIVTKDNVEMAVRRVGKSYDASGERVSVEFSGAASLDAAKAADLGSFALVRDSRPDVAFEGYALDSLSEDYGEDSDRYYAQLTRASE